MKRNSQPVHITWDEGTAYDLFVSISVIHQPERFGLRPSWAAGVRSRLSPSERKILEQAQELFFAPLRWLGSLPAPKDGAAALKALESIEPGGRLKLLFQNQHITQEVKALLESVCQRGAWEDADAAALRQSFEGRDAPPKNKTLQAILQAWSHPAAFGEQYLAALRSYYSVFFQEEEERIRPAIKLAMEQAQEKASRLSVEALLEDLSQGVRFTGLSTLTELVLAPSYWITPFILYDQFSTDKQLVLFGARQAEDALVPGETVPEGMLQALKALADPTRLRILRYLAGQPLTPSQLSRMLRLRAPTVIHHLNALRLAGLVHLTLEESGERRYAMREETINSTFEVLKNFLDQDHNA